MRRQRVPDTIGLGTGNESLSNLYPSVSMSIIYHAGRPKEEGHLNITLSYSTP